MRTYNDTADSTIPSVTPKKRKFDDDDEPEVKHKIVKVEPEQSKFEHIDVILTFDLLTLYLHLTLSV